MFIDEVVVVLKAGDGGNGAVSFRRNAQTPKGGPDGGNGGNGGSIYLQGTTNKADLSQFQYKKNIVGEHGTPGSKNNLFGKNGKDITISVPLGTRVTDIDTNNVIEIENNTNRVLIAKGGRGGRGNNEFKTAVNQTPTEFEAGGKGETKKVKMELRLIADIGFIGYPNAGKSSLLAACTNAKPKIGNFPFTTLHPNLGTFKEIVLADIPGIIEGASKGKGLGIKFLKHIEKTKALVYCIDSTSENPLAIYTAIQKEFKQHDASLLNKSRVIVLTKIDLLTEDEREKIRKLFKNDSVIAVSIYQKDSLDTFKKMLLQLVRQ